MIHTPQVNKQDEARRAERRERVRAEVKAAARKRSKTQRTARSARLYAEGERRWQEKLRKGLVGRGKAARRRRPAPAPLTRRSLFPIEVGAPENARELALQSYREQQAREGGRQDR
jgi:hypothetical protein